MTGRYYTVLGDRGAITVGGADRRDFLQGLVSNDVMRADAGHAVWAAFLTPQGKYLHDFFMIEIGDVLYLDCEGGERLMDFGRRLSRYKLRSRIELGVADGFAVVALWGDDVAKTLDLGADAGAGRSFEGGAVFIDPRLATAGARAILPADRVSASLAGLGFEAATPEDYDRVRIELGLPDGSRDMTVDRTILLEANFDRLNGVDWDKGCYMGQELTARTRYRGLVKRRLMPVEIEGEPPPPGTPLMIDGKDAGEMRSSRDGLGIAMVRLDRIGEAGTNPAFQAAGATVRLRQAAWQADDAGR